MILQKEEAKQVSVIIEGNYHINSLFWKVVKEREKVFILPFLKELYFSVIN